MSEESKEEQPQVIIINFKEQIKTLIEAGKLAEETVKYVRQKHGTSIYIDEGNVISSQNPTLAEYLYRAERKIVDDMNPEIIKEALRQINEELTNIKELLK